jgi:hypothetical protein
VRQLFNYASNPIGPATLALGIVGMVALWRERQRELLAGLLLPILLTLLVALAHRYPFGGSRATMFLVPITFLLAGHGFAAMLRWTAGWQRVALSLTAIALLSGATQTAYRFVSPYVIADIRPEVEYVRGHRSADQAIWITHPNSWVEFLCYWPAPEPLIWGPKHTPQFEQAREFWVIVSFNPEEGIAKRKPQLDAAAKVADPVEQHISRGGSATLFRLRS